MKTIGVIGGGVVGHAIARCFMEHAEVRVYDKVEERSTHNFCSVLDCDLVFLCLPTPQKKDSLECDTSALEDFFKQDVKYNKEANYVIRSTVPIGFTRRMRDAYNLPNLCHSPEFLTARCAVTDAQLPARNIIGFPESLDLYPDKARLHPLRELYLRRFPGIPVLQMSSSESEAVKLILNSFFAVKVSFFNEARLLSDNLGLCWDSILEGVLSDGRIAHSHTRVPGPDGKYGFGGTCLPKDLANLSYCLRAAGLSNAITNAALRRNIFDRNYQSNIELELE